jgi:5-methylcytosine-specific restriction endonuclease McrA
MTLQCRACKLTKDPEQFTVFRRSPSGRSTRCRDCDTVHRNINREHIKAVKRAYYATNTEKVLAESRESYFRNREKRIATALKRQRQPVVQQARRERVRADYKANTAKYLARNHQRRAKVAAAELQKVTPCMLEARASVFGHACAYCGGPHEHWDHVIPLAKGGKHCLANLRPACARCNHSKHAKRLSEWRPAEKAA